MPVSEDFNGLTQQQLSFAKKFVAHRNGTLAAKEAGYAEASAHIAASRLLKQEKILKAIDRLRSWQRGRPFAKVELSHINQGDVDEVEIDRTFVTKLLLDAYVGAKKEKQYAVCVSATMGIAKIHELVDPKSDENGATTINATINVLNVGTEDRPEYNVKMIDHDEAA